MIIVSQYDISFNNKTGVFVKSREKSVCPVCDSKLRSRDSRLRKVIREDGTSIHVRIRRLRCDRCCKLHSELPDFIQPRKQHEVKTIQAALEHKADCITEESTIRRWRREFQLKREQINGILTSIWSRETGRHWNILSAFSLLDTIMETMDNWLAFVNRTIANRGFGTYTQFVFCPSDDCATLSSSLQRKGQSP